MIDNFQQIRRFLDFSNEDNLYYGQIIIRRKDLLKFGENIGSENIPLKDYFFKSLDDLDKKETEIKKICDIFKARFYFYLNKRSQRKTAFTLLKDVADKIFKEEYNSLTSCYSSACGRTPSDENKKWIIDIDDSSHNIDEMLAFVENLEPIGNKLFDVIPTPNGLHYITKPFNSAKFFEKYPNIIIQKDNPTVVYANF